MTKALFTYSINRLGRYFQKNRSAKIITTLLFLLLFIGIGFSVFIFLKKGLSFTAQDPLFARAFSLYIYEMFFLVVGYLVLFSALISGIFGMFRERNNQWIITSPKYKIVPVYVYIRVFFSSMWPFFIITFPALLALRSVFDVGVIPLFLASLVILFFIALVSVLSLIIILAAAKMLSLVRLIGWHVLSLVNLNVLLVLLLILISWLTWQQVVSVDIVELFRISDLSVTVIDSQSVINVFKLFPSHIPAVFLSALQYSEFDVALKQLGYIMIYFFLAFVVFHFFSSWYLRSWQDLQAGSYQARYSKHDHKKKPKTFPIFFKSPIGAVIEKEALATFRTMKNLLWILFLAALFFIQIGLNAFAAREAIGYSGSVEITPQLIQAFQFVISMFFVSAFVLRFALPSFSLERKTAWIMASAPMDLAKLFWAKWWFYNPVFIGIGIAGTLINLWILGIPFNFSVILVLIFVVAIMLLTSLGLMLGAQFPNFETDDPETISTSPAGLMFISISLLYSVWGAYSLISFLGSGSVDLIIMYVIASLIITGMMLSYIPKVLRKIDFFQMN